jgi:hypothetical protein
MALAVFVLSAMASLVGEARVDAALAAAIVRAADEAPLFAGEDGARRTAALLVAVAFRESSLKLDAVGDHGRSFCAFQIHASSGGTAALLTDADACVRKALSMLRESLRVCPAHPVAFYASGPGACTNERAQRISRDRLALAHRLAKGVP